VDYDDGTQQRVAAAEAPEVPPYTPPSSIALEMSGQPLPPDPTGSAPPQYTPMPGTPPNPTEEDLVKSVSNPGVAPYREEGDMLPLTADPSKPLPPAQVDPGSTVLAPGDPGGNLALDTSMVGGGRSEDEFLGDPEAAAAEFAGESNVIADQFDEQARDEQAAMEVEQARVVAGNKEAEKAALDREYQAELLVRESQLVVKAIEDTPIEEDFYKGAPGREIAAWGALALSGFLTGATRGQNPAASQMMQALTRAQENFINNQRADKASKLSLRRDALKDDKLALATIKMQLPGIIEKRMLSDAKLSGMQELPPAMSTAAAKMRLDGQKAQMDAANIVKARATSQWQQESKASEATGPVYAEQVQLRQLGVTEKENAIALDPSGVNLGGKIQGVDRLMELKTELNAMLDGDGNLPHQNTWSWDTIGAAGLAARFGSDAGAAQVRGRALMEEIKLHIKSSSNTKFFDSESEKADLMKMLDSGSGAQTIATLEKMIDKGNRNNISYAKAFTPGNAQGYIDLIRRGQSSNAGSNKAEPKSFKRFSGPTEAETIEGATGEAPAPGPKGFDAALDSVIKHESGGKPNALNTTGTDDHGGIIGFSKANFKHVARAAGRPEVTFDDMMQMTAEEQRPFALAYYKMNGIKATDDAGTIHRLTFLPKYARQGGQLVIGQRGGTTTPDGGKPRSGDPSTGAIYRQNAGFDVDGDGMFTWEEFDKVRSR
jgi:hypothetical protein